MLAWSAGKRLIVSTLGIQVNRKFVLAFILLLNHSLLFGATQSAHIPDVDHPLGYAFHLDETQDCPPHLGELADSDTHADSDADTHPASHGHPGHDHHNHGVHIHLSTGLPYSISLSFDNAGNDQVAAWQPAYGSMSYSPPVPSPNR